MDREHAETAEMLTAGQKSDIEIIIRMYRQQKRHFERNNPRESVKDRIVSISKPYVRPIEHVMIKTKFFKHLTLSVKGIPSVVLLYGNTDVEIELSIKFFKYDVLIAYPTFSAPLCFAFTTPIKLPF